MAISKSITRTTILGDTESSPVTEDEKRQIHEERADSSLDTLLAYADQNRLFAQRLCNKVASKFGPDDELSGLLSGLVRIDRRGKPKGPHKTWTELRYFVLLSEYEVLKDAGIPRSERLELLADKEGLYGVNKTKKIDERITTARRMFSE